MIKTIKKEILQVSETPVSIECDVCKKEYFYDSENTSEIFEIQEFVIIRLIGGYGSVFGDEEEVEIDICQNCFKEKFGEYVRFINED